MRGWGAGTRGAVSVVVLAGISACGSSDAIVGCYSWFTGGIVDIESDGTMEHSGCTGQGGCTNGSGTWTNDGNGPCAGGSNCANYTLHWDNGDVDTLYLTSAGGLYGENQNGTTVTGTPTECSASAAEGSGSGSGS